MGHPVLLDSTNKIVPWVHNTSTDQFATLAEIAWKFWINGSIPNDPATGLPLYFFFGSYSPSTHTGKQWPATPASMVNYLAQTAIAIYAYTGELHPVTTLAVPLARYAIANGTTPRDCVWPSMPYASSDPGAHTFDGANSSRFGGHGQGDGLHVIEPDKAAEAAYGYLLIANLTGDTDIYAAGVAVADTLAAMVRAPPHSNGTASPWPFRVNALTGEVEEQYTSNVVTQLLVFDLLMYSVDATRAASYRRAHRIALDWQRQYPEQNGRWTACCEDVAIDNSLTNYNSMQSLWAAQYLTTKREDGWEERTRSILKFVEDNLIFTDQTPHHYSPAVQWGARCVSEQKVW
jgi:hypothetical protein